MYVNNKHDLSISDSIILSGKKVEVASGLNGINKWGVKGSHRALAAAAQKDPYHYRIEAVLT